MNRITRCLLANYFVSARARAGDVFSTAALSRLGYARKVNFALDAVNGMEEAITLKLPRVTVICRVTPRSIIAFSYPFSCTSRRLSSNFHSVYYLGISISSRDLALFNAFLRLTSSSLCFFVIQLVFLT